jgi:hypothetical protein
MSKGLGEVMLSLLPKYVSAGVGGRACSLERSGRRRFDLETEDDRLDAARETDRRSAAISGELTTLDFLGDLHRVKEGRRDPIR